MITSQVLFLAAGITLAVSPSHAVSLFGITLICAGFSVGFGVAMSQALGPFSLRAGVASSTLGIAQVCGSSLWIWLAAVVGIGAWNMLIGILIACSIVSLLLIMFVAPGRPVAAHEEIHHAGVASSTLGIAQVCGSSLWIWLAAVVGIGAWNMLIGILIACSIVSLFLIMFVAPGRPVAAHEEIHHHA